MHPILVLRCFKSSFRTISMRMKSTLQQELQDYVFWPCPSLSPDSPPLAYNPPATWPPLRPCILPMSSDRPSAFAPLIRQLRMLAPPSPLMFSELVSVPLTCLIFFIAMLLSKILCASVCMYNFWLSLNESFLRAEILLIFFLLYVQTLAYCGHCIVFFRLRKELRKLGQA